MTRVSGGWWAVVAGVARRAAGGWRSWGSGGGLFQRGPTGVAGCGASRQRGCSKLWTRLSCLLGGWCRPLRKGVPRAASTRSVSPRRVWQRGRASARRRLWARCWRTSAAWAYFSGVGVTAADLEPYDLVSYVMDHCLDVHPGRGGGHASPATVDSLFRESQRRPGSVRPRGPATGVGNPVDSVVVADFKAGFRQHALAEGARRAVQLGAVPFVVEHVRELVRGIRARAMDVLRLHPDGASFEVGRSWGPEVVGRAAVPLLRC